MVDPRHPSFLTKTAPIPNLLGNALVKADFLKLELESSYIHELTILISNPEMDLLLQDPQFAEFGERLQQFALWVDDMLSSALCRIDGKSEFPFADRVRLIRSLRKSCRVVRYILAAFGIGELSDRLRRAKTSGLSFFIRRIYLAVIRICSGLSKLGLLEFQCNPHYFRRYLVPKPRGDFLYAIA